MMKFNVLDEVYHFGYGWGFVNEITYKGEEGHRIDVIFKDCDGDKVIKWFDIEGIEWHSCQSFPSIFLKKELLLQTLSKRPTPINLNNPLTKIFCLGLLLLF